jgi:hypothetical protein
MIMKKLEVFSFILTWWYDLYTIISVWEFIQSFYIWQKILFFVMNCYLNFSDEDLLWSSLTDLLIDATATAERKFYWLLASGVSGS